MMAGVGVPLAMRKVCTPASGRISTKRCTGNSGLSPIELNLLLLGPFESWFRDPWSFPPRCVEQSASCSSVTVYEPFYLPVGRERCPDSTLCCGSVVTLCSPWAASGRTDCSSRTVT